MDQITPPDFRTFVHDERGVALFHATYTQLADVVRPGFSVSGSGVDALIVDAPYSEKTHDGASVGEDTKDGNTRSALDYKHWTPADVRAFVETWAPLVRGWWVSMTDDGLAPHWRAEYERAGLYAFATVPAVIRNMTVRIQGDGPSSESVSIMVARPRTQAFARWGTLRGWYFGPREPQDVIGGKPGWLVRELLEHYTRRGDLVVDPCCGGGTLGVAAIATKRRALLGDQDLTHVAKAQRAIARAPLYVEQYAMPLDIEPARKMKQATMSLGGEP